MFQKVLLEFLTHKSNADQEEMALIIWDTFHITVSQCEISRLLKKKKWTKTVICFHKNGGYSLLMVLASTMCCRTKPGAQGALDTKVIAMGRESIDILG